MNVLEELADPVAKFAWDEVSAICKAYARELRAASTEPDAGIVVTVLRTLQTYRRHEDLFRVADAAIGAGAGGASVRREYGQALVDAGRPVASRLMFSDILARGGLGDEDEVEARGGLGRSCKQLFVLSGQAARRVDYLNQAIAAYRDAYDERPGRFWHGINVAALLARAGRDGLPVAGVPDPGEAARRYAAEVRATVSSLPAPDAWALGTASEAALALGNHDEALERARAFVRAPDVDAFKINSYRRQLREIWTLTETTFPGEALLGVLAGPELMAAEGRKLREQGGQAVTIDAGATRADRAAKPDAALEVILGQDLFQSLRWYKLGLARCRAVAQVCDEVGTGLGTGFLVHGDDLHPSMPEWVFVTNAHVVPDAVEADEAVVVFHGLDGDAGADTTFEVAGLLWSRRADEGGLDTALLELREVPDRVDPIPFGKRLPPPGVQRRAYVIGHPQGLTEPQFSLQDNLILDHDDTLLHYRCPTEPGSSGSPVFDDRWRLVGLHHKGGHELPRLNEHGGTYAANEAIRTTAIRAALAADLA